METSQSSVLAAALFVAAARVRLTDKKSDALFYRKPIRINKMVGPEGLERQRPTAFDLPIMRRWERAVPAQ